MKIIEIFNNISKLLQIRKSASDKFRLAAYSRTVALLNETPDILDMDDPTEIRGIGKSIAEKIQEIKATGKCEFYENLKKEIPESLLEILKINNIGPVTINGFWKSGIVTIEDLDKAIENGKVILTSGQVEGYKAYKQNKGSRMLLNEAIKIGTPILNYLKKKFKTDFGGSLRRKKETVKDIDILVCSNNPDEVFKHLSNYKDGSGLEGQKRMLHFFSNGIRIDVLIVPEDEWGAALNHFTGPKDHNIAIRARAIKLGIKVNEKGYWVDGKKIGGDKNEKELYDILKIKYVEPENRDGVI